MDKTRSSPLPFYIYNTLHRRVEEFEPLRAGQVKMYSCGPTVYDYAHIGHARTYINTDVLVRTLRYLGFQVYQVMNITDVGHLVSDADTGEDKVEKKAKKEGLTAYQIADKYTRHFWKMISDLNIVKPDKIVKATNHIKDMIDLIKRLEVKGFTYQIEDGIYFDTSRLADYGKLALVDLKQLQAGARVEMVKGKKHPTDFALWKFSPKDKRRQMEWDSPWGVGFPGWHIECSAMSMKYLGETLDIHTGGVDHVNVHHTNEIAQSEAATGKPFALYWVHFEHVLVEGRKMSKSLNNFYRLEDVISKGFLPLSVRYLFLTSHYRQPFNFTWSGIKAADAAYRRLLAVIARWRRLSRRRPEAGTLSQAVLDWQKRFIEFISHDLKLPEVIGLIWQLVKDNELTAGNKLNLVLNWDGVLGLNLDQASRKLLHIPDEISILAKRRWQMKQSGKFDAADQIRRQIESKGYQVEDMADDYIVFRSSDNKLVLD